MNKAWGSVLLALVTFIVSASSTAALAQAASWTNTLEYTYFLSGAEKEDYGRATPPYGRHVWIALEFKNLTPNRSITAIELELRFLDPFGDLIHTTEPLKFQLGLQPGAEGVTSEFLYYEDNPFTEDLYDELAAPIRNGALEGQAWIQRIAFGDGEVASFPEEWLADSLTRLVASATGDAADREFKASSYVFSDQTAHFESDPVGISARKWRVAWTAFDATPESTLVIEVRQAGVLVVSEEFNPSEIVGGLTVNEGPGTYQIIADGTGVTYTLFVNEANE